ncbi:hypothetical protein WG954_00775 [Lacibacter sp. H375]|uniref:hypothetical protein n=1 Tax=Lacibacter sp. H375 TaxID=3133424 RepID=UPI0030BA48AE
MLLFACEKKKKTIVNRQKAIKKEMEQVKAFYYRQSDSLDRVKEADTSSAKQHEIAEEFVSADRKKSVTLIKLQKEYDSLEVELNETR